MTRSHAARRTGRSRGVAAIAFAAGVASVGMLGGCSVMRTQADAFNYDRIVLQPSEQAPNAGDAALASRIARADRSNAATAAD